ncbi:MAG: hypothetical protein JWO38_868 [Gemmataceae bacterium]|nr:hypothetical protein [Gemmataceae bacterium]
MAKSSKSSLAITRAQFRTAAKPIAVVINGKELTAAAKEFSTGSLGWNINDKLQVEVAGQVVTVQVGLNLTIIGSKDLPQDHVPDPTPGVPPPTAAGGTSSAGQADF